MCLSFNTLPLFLIVSIILCCLLHFASYGAAAISAPVYPFAFTAYAFVHKFLQLLLNATCKEKRIKIHVYSTRPCHIIISFHTPVQFVPIALWLLLHHALSVCIIISLFIYFSCTKSEYRIILSFKVDGIFGKTVITRTGGVIDFDASSSHRLVEEENIARTPSLSPITSPYMQCNNNNSNNNNN